jgi:pseudouridine-5'-phosphate glycosidase
VSTVHLHDDIAQALQQGRPVVAMETAVLTCGLPRTPWSDSCGACPDAIDRSTGLHLATCKAMAAAVRDAGAQPAFCGVLHGEAIVGLDDEQLERLADAPPAKASPDTLALYAARGQSAGTTVGGTLMLLQAAARFAERISVFATGGIGGVHQGWQQRPDISADLASIARVPCAVVCAGAKSILDTTATAEALQTLGVPLLGLGCDRLPGFLAPGDADAPLVQRVDGDAAGVVLRHWALGGGGCVLVQDPPSSEALTAQQARSLAAEAHGAVTQRGPNRTPTLLSAMAERSNGHSLRANCALLIANARAGALLAIAMTNLNS